METRCEARGAGLGRLNTAQKDRAIGAVVGQAVGDALGAGYEYSVPPRADEARMKGGGLGAFAPGEWTDDTTMSVPILQALAAGRDLLDDQTRDDVVREWVAWSRNPKDIGRITAHVLRTARPDRPSDTARAAADAMFRADLPSAGNGSLMRTSPVVLGYLDDPEALATTARTYSHLTHGDPLAADACVLHNLAQRHAILSGDLDIRVGLELIAPDRRRRWLQWIEAAEAGSPREFSARNTFVVRALQAAWSAIVHADDGDAGHLEASVRNAVAIGGDTDTVAAITGGLVGARWGVSAVPLAWRRPLHGCPGLTGDDLVQLASAALGEPWQDSFYPWLDGAGICVRHPHDARVWIGDIRGLRDLPEEVDAVVSLCRVGRSEVPPPRITARNHIHVWLMDRSESEENRHLELVAREAVAMLRALRAEDRTVFLHCVQAHSRTPFIAALYGAEVAAVPRSQAASAVAAVLPEVAMNDRFRLILGV
ncbi:MAG: ADP-ribosylglycohydrolase family protein [Candidatus Nanopelagicales bacterium]|nr:ADP-ribosylglycohydrolase family protein [Candidatus Nanopelagicales bacterium]MCU0295296.1 ADP-ribosylglycohydrolase family protein [Candidatus Nanopelagicales bacterium]